MDIEDASPVTVGMAAADQAYQFLNTYADALRASGATKEAWAVRLAAAELRNALRFSGYRIVLVDADGRPESHLNLTFDEVEQYVRLGLAAERANGHEAAPDGSSFVDDGSVSVGYVEVDTPIGIALDGVHYDPERVASLIGTAVVAAVRAAVANAHDVVERS